MNDKESERGSSTLKCSHHKSTRAKRVGPEERIDQFRILREICIAVASIGDLKEILRRIADSALWALGTEVVVIFLVDEAKRTLFGAAGSTSLGKESLRRFEQAYGATLTELEFPMERGTALIVDTFLDGRPRLGLSPLSVKEISRYEGIIPLLDTAEAAFHAITISMVPLMARQTPLGIMLFLSPEEIHPFDKELIYAFASLAAVSIENARAYHNLKTLNQQIIETLATAIETKDPYTGGHSLKVTQWSIAIGEAKGWASS
jgi:GAF domain-containing protein